MDDSLSDSGTAPAAATTTSELPAASSLGKGRSPSTALVTSFDGPVPRTSCVRTSVFGRVTMLEFEGVEKCKGAPLLEGLPSQGGLTSVIAANYLADQLQLPLVAALRCKDFPARAVINGGRPSHAARILGNQHLVVFLCEFPLMSQMMGDVLDALFDFAERHQSPVIITLEGLPSTEVQRDEPPPPNSVTPYAQIHFMTTHPGYHASLLKYGAKPITHGIIDGITGGLLSQAPYRSTHVLAMLAEVEKYDPGSRAAAAIVRALDEEVLDVYLDISPLEMKAAMIESKVKEAIKNHTPKRDELAYYT